MIALRNWLYSAVVGIVAAGALSVSAYGQIAPVQEGDVWDTGPGTTQHTVSDPAIFANGVDTGVLAGVGIGNGIVVTLSELGGGISDYIYTFGAAGAAPHIWFLSDTQDRIALPPQLGNINLTITNFTETGDFQDMVNAQGQNIFGTRFRVRSDLDPIPEPGAWALMILGFGCAGAMLRRRARLAFISLPQRGG